MDEGVRAFCVRAGVRVFVNAAVKAGASHEATFAAKMEHVFILTGSFHLLRTNLIKPSHQKRFPQCFMEAQHCCNLTTRILLYLKHKCTMHHWNLHVR